jgi:hypothetical protein
VWRLIGWGSAEWKTPERKEVELQNIKTSSLFRVTSINCQFPLNAARCTPFQKIFYILLIALL